MWWLLWACQKAPEIKERSDPNEIRAALLHHVPIESERHAATTALQQLGFACGAQRSPDFPGASTDEICDLQRADGVWTPVRWQVALQIHEGKVADLQVSPGMVGP